MRSIARPKTWWRGTPRTCCPTCSPDSAISSSRSCWPTSGGHAIQDRSNFTARTVTKELQADCFAGGWAKHAKDAGVYKVNAADMDNALAGILELRDSPGSSKIDPSAHGSGFDRVSAFQDGFDNGPPTACKAYRDDDPVVLELPFQTAEDEASGGELSYDSIVNDVPYDIEDYWAHVYPELTDGEAWVPVKGLEPFDPSNPPMCGNTRAEGYALFYCVPDDYIGWDNESMRAVYNKGHDYAVATLIATQFGLAAMTRANDKSDDKTQSLRGDCFAGGLHRQRAAAESEGHQQFRDLAWRPR